MSSLLDCLRKAELTTLNVRHDWRTGESMVFASRDWDEDLEFAQYRKTFDHESRLTSTPKRIGDAESRQLLTEVGAGSAMERLLALMRDGRHQAVDFWVHPRRPIGFISNMHSNVLGIANCSHAIRAGGIRRHELAEPEEEVLVDGLNLARGMSFKNAAAQIPFGGSKICVHSNPIGLDDLEGLGFLAWCIDQSRCFTGPDMGFEPEHADILRTHFTRNIVGGPAGALGPTGGPTAQGVFLSLKEAVKHHLDKSGFDGLDVAVQGLGAVGAPLAHLLLEAGVAQLLVADSGVECLASFLADLPEQWRGRTRSVDPDKVLFEKVDIVSPNAIGGVFSAEEIDRLQCRIVMGGANNQLRATSQEGEAVLAERLANRGILYQVDWMHNTAGVIAGCEEYLHQEDAHMDRVVAHLERVCGEGVRANLFEARKNGYSPTAMAYRRIEERIYPTHTK